MRIGAGVAITAAVFGFSTDPAARPQASQSAGLYAHDRQGLQSPATPMPSGAATEPRPGVISGRVVDGSTNSPVAGAIITLATGPSEFVGLPKEQVLDRQATDSSGRFLFTGVTPLRAHYLRASKPGYADGLLGPGEKRGPPRRIVLGEGQWLSDAAIRLWRPNAISGTIADETGEPLPGVYVAAIARVTIAGLPAFASSLVTRTDDRGVYRLAPLMPGTYAVMVPSLQFAVYDDLPAAMPAGHEPAGVTRDGMLHFNVRPPTIGLSAGQHAIPSADGGYLVTSQTSLLPPDPGSDGRRLAYVTTFYPGVRALDGAALIELEPGDERAGINFSLSPVPVSRLSGVVEGPAGAVANRRLRLMAAGADELGIGHEAAIAITAPDGRFSFPNVPEGQYTILAASRADGYTLRAPGQGFAPSLQGLVSLLGGPAAASTTSPAENVAALLGRPSGYLPSTIRLQSDTLARSDGFFARVPVSIGEADRSDVVVRLQTGVAINGRLVIATPEDREALAIRKSALEVVAEPAAHAPGLSGARARAPLTASSLDFRLSGLRPGDYVLRMYADSGRIRSITWNGRDYTALPITVADRDLMGMVVTVTHEAARAEGTVRDRSGSPAENAAVIYFPVDPERWQRYGPQPDRLRSVAVTSGRYTIPAVPAGDYYLVAVDDWHADGWREPDFLKDAAAVATRVTLRWGQTEQRDLPVTEVAP
jgi:protocatechuate 3,4-dioxygenase beta subunit